MSTLATYVNAMRNPVWVGQPLPAHAVARSIASACAENGWICLPPMPELKKLFEHAAGFENSRHDWPRWVDVLESLLPMIECREHLSFQMGKQLAQRRYGL